MNLFNLIMENGLLVESLLTLASASIPALGFAVRIFKQRNQLVTLFHALDTPNQEIVDTAKAHETISREVSKLLEKQLMTLKGVHPDTYFKDVHLNPVGEKNAD